MTVVDNARVEGGCFEASLDFVRRLPRCANRRVYGAVACLALASASARRWELVGRTSWEVQWQWKNSLTVPSGRTLKCSTKLVLNAEPSEPVPRTLNVKVPFTVWPLALKPPQIVNLPV